MVRSTTNHYWNSPFAHFNWSTFGLHSAHWLLSVNWGFNGPSSSVWLCVYACRCMSPSMFIKNVPRRTLNEELWWLKGLFLSHDLYLKGKNCCDPLMFPSELNHRNALKQGTQLKVNNCSSEAGNWVTVYCVSVCGSFQEQMRQTERKQQGSTVVNHTQSTHFYNLWDNCR